MSKISNKRSLSSSGSDSENDQENTKKANTNTTPSKSTPKINNIIIDNSSDHSTYAQKITSLTTTINKEHIKSTRQLKQGGIEVVPSSIEGMNSLLKISNYDLTIFGENVYPHLAGVNDQRPWLCINKVPYSKDAEIDTLKNIKHQLQSMKIETLGEGILVEGLHRKYNSKNPTSLILFKTKNEIHINKLIESKIKLTNINHDIRKYIDKKNTQCTKCKRVGHLKTNCKFAYTCGRCGSEKCPVGKCTAPNGTRKCINCKQPHSSTWKGCPILKQDRTNHFNKQKLEQTQQQHIKYTNNKINNTTKSQDQAIKEIHTKHTLEFSDLKKQIAELKNTIKEQETAINNLKEQAKKHNDNHEREQDLLKSALQLTDENIDEVYKITNNNQNNIIKFSSKIESVITDIVPRIIIQNILHSIPPLKQHVKIDMINQDILNIALKIREEIDDNFEQIDWSQNSKTQRKENTDKETIYIESPQAKNSTNISS